MAWEHTKKSYDMTKNCRVHMISLELPIAAYMHVYTKWEFEPW